MLEEKCHHNSDETQVGSFKMCKLGKKKAKESLKIWHSSLHQLKKKYEEDLAHINEKQRLALRSDKEKLKDLEASGKKARHAERVIKRKEAKAKIKKAAEDKKIAEQEAKAKKAAYEKECAEKEKNKKLK